MISVATVLLVIGKAIPIYNPASNPQFGECANQILKLSCDFFSIHLIIFSKEK